MYGGAGALLLALLCVPLALTIGPSRGQDTPPQIAGAGRVRLVISTTPQWDLYTRNPSKAMRQWLRDNSWRILTFSPYFDSRLNWDPDAWVYQDLYAIYPGSEVLAAHPDWVLRDAKGNPLYIPWGCANGTCPQYAGDVSNQAFRNWWIGQAQKLRAIGYRGLWIDDVNLEFRVSDGYGNQVAPIDPQTGAAMLYQAWRQYVAEFTTQIRASLPGWEIVHNAIWFADTPARLNDPSVREEVSAADYINLEQGVTDPGLVGGNGPYSLSALLSYIDGVHKLGPAVVLGNTSDQTDYPLAAYFLISNGHDALSQGNRLPNRWWSGLDANLGTALNARQSWRGVLRRDFSNGTALVNPPQNPTAQLDLQQTFRQLDGTAVNKVTLRPAEGIVLLTPSPQPVR